VNTAADTGVFELLMVYRELEKKEAWVNPLPQ